MRLDQMTPAHVRRAVALYVDCAFPGAGVSKKPALLRELEDASSIVELLGRFERVGGGDGDLKRYALRIGNARYPFMKFIVQEHLVDDEFFFSVDTHDNLEIRPDNPDFAEWERVKEYNREMKDRIEKAWDADGLPTNTDLRALAEEIARLEREESKRCTLLMVDDESELAMGLAALLRARGYDVELACNGLEALERLARDPLPDLVLLDYEMPQLDGEEVLRRLRENERTEDLPVLLATASTVDLTRLRKVSGVLRKPYPRAVLFEMIRRMLGDKAFG
ncbi:MAG: CheY-like chemotaxis protein [Planctomycetota bacterium]|jgi:CheY-like chemotaxis protein